jgi:hypothetical protein
VVTHRGTVRLVVGTAALLLGACQPQALHFPDGGAGTSGGGGGGRAGAGAGGAGVGGAGGMADACNAAATAMVTTDPWPTSCLSFYGGLPANTCLLTGPSASGNFGVPAASGETMTATLNGLPRSFSNSFDVSFADPTSVRIFGYGDDGELGITAFPAALGTYACPNAMINFADIGPGMRATNAAYSGGCCTIVVTTSGAVGEPIEGTFSGILLNASLNVWVKVEAGSFRVIRGAPADAGVD